MFILIDTFPGLSFMPFHDHIDGLDDKPVRRVDSLEDYQPNGSFHIVDELRPEHRSRWSQLRLATLGARVFSDIFDKESPLYAGPIPEADKIRKISVDAAIAETRAVHFASSGVNYLGRTKLSPRNIFVLDNKKGNPLHDPSKDQLLEALYGSLPDDWWGSCGFVSSGNADKLGAFLDDFQGDVIPLAWTTGAFSKLKYLGLDFVEMAVPDGTPAYGVTAREASNRLSYKLSEPAAVEGPTDAGWLQL